MKRFLAIGALVAGVLLLVPTGARAASLARPANNLGISTYWNFNENVGTQVGDLSGKGNTGSFTGSPSWITGRYGTALQFNGSSNYVSKTSPTGLNTGATARSMSAWIKINTAGTTMVPFVYGSCSPNGAAFGVYVDSSRILHFWGCGDDFTTTYTLQTGVWYHIVITTASGATVSVYVNGALVTTGTPTGVGNLVSPSGTAYLNAGSAVNVDPGNYYFNGAVDDLRYYNRTLPAAEVAYLYTAGATQVRAPNNLGLVGSWNFDEGSGTQAGDTSGNKNNGTLSGTTLPAWVSGKHSTALNFDGAAAYVTVPNSASLSITASTTISAWFKIAGLQGGVQTIVSKWGGVNAYFLGYNDNTKKIRFYLSGPVSFDSSAVSVEDGKWHLVTATYDQSFVRVYLDGVLVSSQVATGAIVSNTQALRIGRDNTGFGTAYFNGSIDDVRVYSRALSASEIAGLYSQGATQANASSIGLTNGSSLQSGLVGLWTFDGPDTTDKIYDRSGQGNNGYVFSAVSTSSMKTIGRLGQALQFNSSGGGVRISDASSLNPATVTISTWIYSTGSSPSATSERIIDKANSGTISQGGYRMQAFTAVNCGSASPEWGVQWYNGSAQLLCGPTIPSTNGTWTNLVFTHDGTTARIYTNGVLVNSLTASYTTSNTFNLGIGNSDQVSRPFTGKIDDVRIYNRALSAAEVQQLYLVGK